MLDWKTVDPNANFPAERLIAHSTKCEYRIFRDPAESHGKGLGWILTVRATPGGGVPEILVHLKGYRTEDAAKLRAELWDQTA